MAGGVEAALNYLATGLAKNYESRMDEEKLIRAEGRAAKRWEDQKVFEMLNSGDYLTEIKNAKGETIARKELSDLEKAQKEASLASAKSTVTDNKTKEMEYNKGLSTYTAYENDTNPNKGPFDLWLRRKENSVDIDGKVSEQAALAPGKLREHAALAAIDSKYSASGSGGKAGKHSWSSPAYAFVKNIISGDATSVREALKASGITATPEEIKQIIQRAELAKDPAAIQAIERMSSGAGFAQGSNAAPASSASKPAAASPATKTFDLKSSPVPSGAMGKQK